MAFSASLETTCQKKPDEQLFVLHIVIRLLSTYLGILRTVKMILLLLLIRASTCLAWGDIEGHMLPKSDPRMEKMPSNSSSSTSAAALSQTHKTFLTDPSGYLAASRQEVTSHLSGSHVGETLSQCFHLS